MPRRAVPTALSVALISALLVTTPTAAAPPAGPPAATGPGSALGLPTVTRPTTVTLVTGDRVALAPEPDGTTRITLEPATRPSGFRPVLRMVETKDRRLVVPDDATPFLAAGVLDETLFDVNYLVANGYADNVTNRLPLITQLRPTVPAAKVRSQADAVPGVTPTVQLTSLHATAAVVPKAQAGAFWASIAGTAATPAAGRQAARSFSRSVAKVWLDKKLRASLDKSVPLIGAPQAWAAGYNGQGVKVAVLDTGIDQSHPDLKGRVTASKNFTPDADIADGHGHGTHVASTITGSGAASGGKYKGVAPGVDLLVGKVLDHGGTGQESGVIAGMEWAVAQGAKVINLSLGATAPADESRDAGALAVDRLTAASGALFVIAAGNAGGTSTVGTPGVAKAALTVAATDKSDQLAYYSSRGPLPYDNRASKPDIAGPGSEIVAARAAGTSMGNPTDANYTSASGTSMATPHVAGAAAILAQRYPDWSAPQLKAALMSTSKDLRYSGYEQGAGRVDLVRAISQQVVGVTATVDFGRISKTEQGDVVRQVTYRNDTAADVTLALTDSLRSASGADISTTVDTPAQVVVPARGTATVDVTVHAGQLGDGFASGAVVATADAVQVRTPIALRRAVQTFPVQIDVKFSAPAYFGGSVDALNLDDSAANPLLHKYLQVAPDRMSGTITLELPPGRWAIGASHDRLPPTQRHETVWFAEPELTVQGPTQLSFDDKDAMPFSVRTDTPTQSMGGGVLSRRTTADGKNELNQLALLSQFNDGDFFAAPTKPVTVGTYSIKFNSIRGLPRVQLAVDSANGRGLSMTPNYSNYAGGGVRFEGTRKKLLLVDLGWSLEPEELATVRGKLVLMSFTWGHGGYECNLRLDDLVALKAAGAVGVLQESGSCELYPQLVEGGGLPVAGIDSLEGVELRKVLAKGPVTVTLKGVPYSPVVYHLAHANAGRIPDSLTYRVHDRELARIRTSFTPEWQPGTPYGAKGYVGQRLNPALEPHLFMWPNYLEKLPESREELFGPITPDAKWVRAAGTDFDLVAQEERRTTLRPGRMPDERWLGAPRGIGPSDVPPATTNLNHMGFCFACRDGDRLVIVPTYANQDPLVVPALNIAGAQAKLYRDGRELPGTTYTGGFPAFTLPSDAGRYKLVLDSDLRTGPLAAFDLYKYSAKQHTEWTFGSAHVGTPNVGNTTCLQAWSQPDAGLTCAPQQLLYLRYSAPTDQNNKVSRGLVPLQIKPYYERTAKPVAAAAFKSVKAAVSYDSGKTWKPVAGVNLRGVYKALLAPPRGATTATLRVDAVDLNGNTVSQTINDLFGIR